MSSPARGSARMRVNVTAAALVAAVVLILPMAAQAEPSPGWRVIGATGPTNLPPRQSEVQRVRVKGGGGTFTVSPTTAEGEGTLGYGSGISLGYATGVSEITFFSITSGAFDVGQEITAGPGISAGTLVTAVSGDGLTITLSQPTTSTGTFSTVAAASSEVIGVSAEVGGFHPGDSISGSGIPAGATITAATPGSLTISQLPTAAGAVSLSASETTGPIDFDAAPSGAASFQEALEALPGFGPGAATVVGGPGDPTGDHPYSVTLEGSYADQNAPLMSADGSELTGDSPSATVRAVREGGPGTGELAAYATNVGGAPTSAPIRVKIGPLPLHVMATTGPGLNGSGWACSSTGTGEFTVECDTNAVVPPGNTANPVKLPLAVDAGAPESSVIDLTVEGGGATDPYSYQEPVTVSPQPAKAGIAAFAAGAFNADGTPATQAGGHPDLASTAFFVNTMVGPNGTIVPAGDPKTVEVELPPGFIGNPTTTPRCAAGTFPLVSCPADSVVGEAVPLVEAFGAERIGSQRVFNFEPPVGYPAIFKFEVVGDEIAAVGELRSDGDYGITVSSLYTPQIRTIFGTFFAFRGSAPGAGSAFLTNPTDCAGEALTTPVAILHLETWQEPGAVQTSSVPLPPVVGCSQLASKFNPSFSMQPKNHDAASPSAFTGHLSIPQEGLTEPEALAAPELKKASVILPRGLDVNPASANGLQACSGAQIGLTTTSGAMPNPIRFDKSQPSCPEASKLGTVEARTPLLEDTVEGTIYLAKQEENPFHSLLALYVVLNDPKDGILVKLPGEVKPDPDTGQLTATFDYNPQLPVEDLKLNFRGGGPRSPLATPAVCGTYTTNGTWTPWSAPESGPPAQTHDNVAISTGRGGGACATSEAGLPFAPSFEAGTTSTQAGAYAPLVIKLARKDGEQELTHLEFTLPPGLTGRLAGIPYCPDSAIEAAKGKTGRAEQAGPSCPGASELGTVDTSAGVGSEPIHVGGHVYLAGPYEGAPLSTVVITPAVAGPFDLGTVVVRAPLFVNPETAQITAKTDEIPHILKGIPLQLRSVEIKVTRVGFTLNPTSCDPMSVTSSMSGLNGGSSSPSSRFQVAGCKSLRFKPKLKLRVIGKTNRNAKPRLKAVLTTRPGEANIRRAQVNLPHSEFLEQNHIKTVCTRVQFAEGNGNGSACPKGSIYGKARAWTPLLAHPLEGYLYLRSNGGERKLPDLVAALNGQISIALWGKVDSGPNKGIRNTFEVVPDAPVSRFVLEMFGKKKGLLVNSENLCARKAKTRAVVRLVAQNGKVRHWKPTVGNQCKKRHAKKAKRHGRNTPEP